MRAGALRSRALEYFVEPATPPPAESARVRSLRPVPVVAAASRGGATRHPLRAAVLGGPAAAPAVAGALACALRAAARSSTAAVAVWAPDGRSAVPRHRAGSPSPPVSGGPAWHGAAAPESRPGPCSAPRPGPAIPAASRLAARLASRGFTAAARGRLAWVALDEHPVAASVAARRLAGALEVPLVTVLAGARCEILEGLLAEQDLVLVVAEDPEGPLARLAVASCAAAALACGPLDRGPARWRALAGLAGARVLAAPARALVRDLAEPPVLPPEELAW